MEIVRGVITTAARWLFILCLPVLLLTASIGLAVNSQWLYEYGFNKYDVRQTTGLADSELEKAASGLISYFNSNDEIIDLTVIKDSQPFTLFNEREMGHLKDVKGLIWLDYRVLLGTGIYVLIYAVISLCWLEEECRRQLAKAAIAGSGLTLGLMLLVGLVAVLDFGQFFLWFHHVSFANDLWLLDPSKDYLIMLFPEGFWYDATIFLALLITTLAVLIAGVAWGYLIATRRKPLF